MGVVSTIDELDARLDSELDPFGDMCGPKSQSTFSSYKVGQLCPQMQKRNVHVCLCIY